MSPAPVPPRRFLVAAISLLTAFAVQSYLSSRVKSPVFDEPAHIAAGLSYIETGSFAANRQHPPLLKEMSAILMLLGGVHWSNTPEARSLVVGSPGLEWTVGNAIISENGPDRVMFWARLPFILLATLLGALIYFWGREITGEVPALAALFLYTLDPTILAHSYLVTTDVGVATLGVLFLTMLWRYVRNPAWNGMALCGVSLGLALTAKFSALCLVPVAVVLLAAGLRNVREKDRILSSPALAPLVMCLIAMLAIQFVYFSPSGLASFVEGARAVNRDHDPNYLVFLAGRLQHRFSYYFPVAYLLKEPLACIGFVVVGVFVIVASKKVTVLQKLFLLVPAVALGGAYSLFADDLGVRYLIPVLPFAYLIGGAGLARLISNSAIWARGLATVLCLWLVITAIGIYPDHLSYFNEAACVGYPNQIGWDGGTRCGPEWLDDSNVDWGQGLKQLSDWARRHGNGQQLQFAYFGSLPPSVYGLSDQPNAVRELAAQDRPNTGWYAVSAHWVARIPALVRRESPGRKSWLSTTPPSVIVGHSIYVYEIAR